MMYLVSVNVIDMSYNFLVLLILSFVVFMFFVCFNEFCWVEIECMLCKLIFFFLFEKINIWEWFFFV